MCVCVCARARVCLCVCGCVCVVWLILLHQRTAPTGSCKSPRRARRTQRLLVIASSGCIVPRLLVLRAQSLRCTSLCVRAHVGVRAHPQSERRETKTRQIDTANMKLMCCAYKHAQRHKRARAHADRQTDRQTDTHTHTHTHTSARARAHTHTHTPGEEGGAQAAADACATCSCRHAQCVCKCTHLVTYS